MRSSDAHFAGSQYATRGSWSPVGGDGSRWDRERKTERCGGGREGRGTADAMAVSAFRPANNEGAAMVRVVERA